MSQICELLRFYRILLRRLLWPYRQYDTYRCFLISFGTSPAQSLAMFVEGRDLRVRGRVVLAPAPLARGIERTGERRADAAHGIGFQPFSYDGEKAGIELVIGGESINGHLDDVMTLANVRQLRDNLTALLDDPRVVAVIGESLPVPTTPATPSENIQDKVIVTRRCDDTDDEPIRWTDYRSGDVVLGVKGRPPQHTCVYYRCRLGPLVERYV